MHQLYQTVPTGELKSNPAAAFVKTADGPVVVLSRATPKVVMGSPEEQKVRSFRADFPYPNTQKEKKEEEDVQIIPRGYVSARASRLCYSRWMLKHSGELLKYPDCLLIV